MAFESSGGQKFPYSYDQVFNGLLRVLPQQGFKIKEQDKNLGRLLVSSGMSLFSFGENIDISVEDVDGYSTRLELHSSLKVQGSRMAIFTGEGRNTKNINAIIFALNDYLKTQPRPQRPTVSAVPPSPAPASPQTDFGRWPTPTPPAQDVPDSTGVETLDHIDEGATDEESQPKELPLEACANCGRKIGRLETPHVWKGSIVCAQCRKVLETG